MKSIEKVSIIDSVVSNIKELIISKEVAIGEKLPTEREICEQLNVSRSTVREAYRVLQAMGFVKIKHGKGAFVAKNEEDELNNVLNWFSENEIEIADLMEVRMAMEPLAIKLAIKRSTDKELDQLVKNLKKIQENFNEATEAGDILKLEILDNAFHNSIIMATRNKLLNSIYEKVSRAIMEYRVKIFSIKQNTKNAYHAHEKIIDAISKKDINQAVISMSAHVDEALIDAMNLINKK